MKFSTLASLSLVSGLVAASPLPAVEYVTVTHYTTVRVNQAEYAAAQKNTANPDTTQTAAAATTSAASTKAEAAAATTEAEAAAATTEAAEATSSTETATTVAPVANTADTTSTATTADATTADATTADSASTGETFSGEGTYYDPGMGACGVVSTESDHIVALSHLLYDQYTPNGNPNKNTLCGNKINVHYGGKTVQVTVVDRCEACEIHDLDLSPSAFSEIADQALGRIDITWEWAS